MKYILTIFLFFAVKANGQNDTGSVYQSGWALIGGGTTGFGIGIADTADLVFKSNNVERFRYADPKLPVYDTIKVIMLVCDTSKQDAGFGKKIYINGVSWATGYSVRKLHYGNEMVNGCFCLNCPDYWVHQFYISDEKTALSKNIIVWQSIAAKP